MANIDYKLQGLAAFTVTTDLVAADEGKLVAPDGSNNDKCIVPAAEVNFAALLTKVDANAKLATLEKGMPVTVPYSGGAPGRGAKVELIADGSGGVKTPAVAGTGKDYEVWNVDTGATKITFWLPV